MPRYKVSVVWEGENSTIDDFENEQEAEEYGYEFLADGCASCCVNVELVEDIESDVEESD